MGTLLRCLLKGIVLLWCCLDCSQSANVPNTNRDLEHQAGQIQWNAKEIPENRVSGTCVGKKSKYDDDCAGADKEECEDQRDCKWTELDVPDWVLSGKPPPETEPASKPTKPPSPLPKPDVYCPPLFSMADTLFCNGECGTDFESGDDDETSEHGCGQGDADAFCKLTLCDEGAVALKDGFDKTKEEHDVPGFACDMCNHRRKRRQNRCKKNLHPAISIHEGNFFGIVDVYFTNDTAGSHPGTNGDVVSNVVCKPSKPSPTQCIWSEFEIGECSEECGTGTRTNTRTWTIVDIPGYWYDTIPCRGPVTEVEECKIKECPVHCEATWEETECSQECAGGTKTKTRTIITQGNEEGTVCTGPDSITVSCNEDPCPVKCYCANENGASPNNGIVCKSVFYVDGIAGTMTDGSAFCSGDEVCTGTTTTVGAVDTSNKGDLCTKEIVAEVVEETDCVDKVNSCESKKTNGFCAPDHGQFDNMNIICLKTCGLCKEATGPFTFGKIGENICPSGYVYIKKIEDCKSAAAGLGLTYDFDIDDSHSPKGCLRSGNFLYFNKHATGGAPGGRDLLVCKQEIVAEVVEETVSCEDNKNGATSPNSGSTYSCSSDTSFCTYDWFNAACKQSCGKCLSEIVAEVVEETVKTCQDYAMDDFCTQVKKHGDCEKHGSQSCRKTCNQCESGQSSCLCRDFVNSAGYGNCKKEHTEKGAICYVKEPSTCTDAIPTDDYGPYSWEACNKGINYEKSEGACQGGTSPENLAGQVLHLDGNCKDLCDNSDTCAAYLLPVDGSTWCETYTSAGATGDGRKAYECFTKQTEGSKYVHSLTKGRCCIYETRPHQVCYCSGSDVALCKQLCDGDKLCKGYAGRKGGGCLVATTSECQGDCKQYDKGNDAPLVPKATCGFEQRWDGCFVKQTSEIVAEVVEETDPTTVEECEDNVDKKDTCKNEGAAPCNYPDYARDCKKTCGKCSGCASDSDCPSKQYCFSIHGQMQCVE